MFFGTVGPGQVVIRGVLFGTAGLSVAALAAFGLTIARAPVIVGSASLRAAVRATIVAVLCQTAHFAEELATSFPRRFPPLFGLVPWSISFFVAFNVSWIVIWSLSCAGLARGIRAAEFALWFLAVASLANGLAHPLASVYVGGYFPGLITSPVIGVAGVLLLRRLILATGRADRASAAV